MTEKSQWETDMSIRVERIRFNFLIVGFWNRAKMVFLTYKFKKGCSVHPFLILSNQYKNE